MADDPELRSDVRSYYRTVGGYIEREPLTPEDETFWRREVRRSGGSRVLELGCGTGRVTRVLAEEAESVVALDLSPDMLRRARRRLSGRPRAHLLLADMRSFRFARSFHLVVAANDPFIHLVEDRDRRRAVEAVARHLQEGRGRFVLDAHWLAGDRMRSAAAEGGIVRERSGGPADPELEIRERWSCDPETRRCAVRYEYHRGGAVVDRASFRGRLWSLDELHRTFEGAGLRIRSLWGGFDRRPFDPEAAAHLIVEAVPE